MTRLQVAAPLLAAAALAAVAVATVREAGCDDPGRYVAVPGGYELVGGCVSAADLVVPDSPASTPASKPAHDRG